MSVCEELKSNQKMFALKPENPQQPSKLVFISITYENIEEQDQHKSHKIAHFHLVNLRDAKRYSQMTAPIEGRPLTKFHQQLQQISIYSWILNNCILDQSQRFFIKKCCSNRRRKEKTNTLGESNTWLNSVREMHCEKVRFWEWYVHSGDFGRFYELERPTNEISFFMAEEWLKILHGKSILWPRYLQERESLFLQH